MKLHYLLIIFALGLISFQVLDKREILVQERLKEKLEQYKLVQLEKCQSDILKSANEKVDSILLAQAKNKTVDTVEKPPVPRKPHKPVIKTPKDTSAIAPIIY